MQLTKGRAKALPLGGFRRKVFPLPLAGFRRKVFLPCPWQALNEKELYKRFIESFV